MVEGPRRNRELAEEAKGVLGGAREAAGGSAKEAAAVAAASREQLLALAELARRGSRAVEGHHTQNQ
jgi:hypothetical protein